MNPGISSARWLLLAAGGVISAGAVLLSGGLSSAQSPTPGAPESSTPSTQGTSTTQDLSYDEILAEELGISVEELRAAQSNATERYFDQLVASGDLTPEQAASLKTASAAEVIGEAVDNPGFDMVRNFALSQIANFLEMDRGELERQLSEGKSLKQVAEEQGLTEDDIRSELQSRADQLVGMIEQAGLVDSEQATDLRETIQSIIDDAVGEPGGSGTQSDDAGVQSGESTATPAASPTLAP